MNKTDIRSMRLEQLKKMIADMRERSFRAKQLYEWMHVKHVSSFEEMTNLPKSLREKLQEMCDLTTLEIVGVQESRLDGTRKYLFRLPDGNVIESVLMRYKHGNSVCISSQAGCRMGCRFCASAIGGLVRGLTPAEMLEQVYRVGQDIGERISNVVVMGTGEPLDNYKNLIAFIDMLTDENGLNIGQRSVTVSTCGLVPEIYALADHQYQITLALSLHAASQEKRLALMPVAQKYSLEETLEACNAYFKTTGRRVTYEYSLIRDVNDSLQDAQQLSALLRGKNCHVNLIPANPVKERNISPSKGHVAAAFKNELEKNGINVTIRREMGRDIDGACGQLRRRYQEER